MEELLKFKKIIDAFPIKNKTTSLLIQISPEESLEAQIVLTKMLTDRDFKMIILSGGRPCRDLISIYEEKNVNLKNVQIIDTICKSQKLTVKDTERTIHITTIRSLTEIAIYINKMMVSNKTVLFIDSITSMLLYNDEEVFTKFLSDVVRKMKNRGVHLILLIIKTKSYDSLRSELKYLCDQQVIF